MLGAVSQYAAINSRVRAMYSGLLSDQEWVRLCEAQDLSGVIAALKDSAYGPYVEHLEDRTQTARRAVFEIKRHLADDYTGIIQSSPQNVRPLLTQLYRHFELGNLKAVLRGILGGASWDQVRFVLFPFGSMTVVPAQAMVETGSVTAAVELLRGTPYYDVLSFAMGRYNAEHSLFPLEVALDLNYWRQLWRGVGELTSQNRTQALRVVGTLADLTNLMWAIRYRVYYELSEEEIINYTLSMGYHVHDDDIRAIAAGVDISQVVARVFPDLRDADTLLHEPRSGLPGLELELQRRLAAECRAEFSGYPFHIGIPLAYLILSELEIQDLTVLIEAKAAQMPADEYQPHLITGCTPA